MKNFYLQYLKTLSKDKLIYLIYNPYRKQKAINHVSYRTIALLISYHGEKYRGLAECKDGDSIGNRIKNALLLSTLADHIVYAGRTDKGVSAIGMVASVKIKSLLRENTSRYFLNDDDNHEFNYQAILNNYLPEDIRVIGWAPVEDGFSARFTCIKRKYRYYFTNPFVKIKNQIRLKYDINKMEEMCQKILTLKNFYNLSKHSDKSARYNRTVDICQIIKEGDLYYLDIQAKSFLHNMVRKIFWVLEMAGKDENFDWEKIGTSDPQNLVFYEAVFPVNLCFLKSNNNIDAITKDYNTCLAKQKIVKLIFESQLK
ncbi:hypothetical protein NCER_100100 [Vairimorpha ceranae BRL01]|uniref:tRNA pseudouridine synthase n=1 Tax=Vairimorpha ceranae (strain BRL01) TaxID=578460 RepID=C4V6Q9_VAIC1|nr:hypothetical protein NCER_100100 [Vairimorpha ceranae BRL01]